MSDIDNFVLIVWIIWILTLFIIAINLFKYIVNMPHEEKFKGGRGISMIDLNLRGLNMPPTYPDDIDEFDILLINANKAIIDGAKADKLNNNHQHPRSEVLIELRDNLSSLFRNNDNSETPYLHTKEGRQTEYELKYHGINITSDIFQSMFDNCIKNLYGIEFIRRNNNVSTRFINLGSSAELLGGLFVEYNYAHSTYNEVDQDGHYYEIYKYILNMFDIFY